MVMTIDDEISMLPATTGDGAIVPEGRWTMEVLRLEKAPPSDFKPEDGPRIKWIFGLYDGPDMPKGERFHFNGEPYELYRHTSRKNSPRAFARQYAEALLGRKLDDSEVPPLSHMIGKRMSALISYEGSISDPSKEVLKLSSFKPMATAVPAPASRPAPAPKPAADQVSADATGEDVDRALIVTKLQKQATRLVALNEPAGHAAQDAIAASDLDTAPLSALQSLSDAITAQIVAAASAD